MQGAQLEYWFGVRKWREVSRVQVQVFFVSTPIPETLVFHIINLIILLNKRIGAEIL